jgi:hypothetical protein
MVRLSRHPLPIVFALLLLIAVWSCASKGERLAGITLDSGVDKASKRTDSYDEGAMASAGVSTNQNFDTNYRQPTTSSQQYGADDPPAESSGGKPGASKAMDSRMLAGIPNIDAWFVPSAYAAENKVSEKYLIRNGTLDIKIDSIDTGQAAANSIAAKYGGTVTNTSIQKNSDGYRSGFVTLRVPAERFQQVWADLMKIPEIEVLSQNIETQDVGAEYVSSVSRLKALTAEQQTLQKMLDEALAVQRSRGLGEAYKVLLDTQTRLSEVTQEIQGVEDRVKVLADQITRSTVTLNMTENPKIPAAGPPDKFNWGLGNTFNAAVRQLLETARATAQAVIYFIVTLQWVWWLLAFFVLRWAWKYYKRVMATERVVKPVVSEPPTG